MPGARRKRKGQTGRGPDAQIKRPSGPQGGGGPANFDGTRNTNAGTKPERVPGGASDFSGRGKVVETN